MNFSVNGVNGKDYPYSLYDTEKNESVYYDSSIFGTGIIRGGGGA